MNPVLLRREIGNRVRLAREATTLTLDAAAELDIGRSTLSRIETGHGPVSIHLARSMLELYRIFDDEELLDLVRAARRKGWWKEYGISDTDFIALESGASRISAFQPDLVPGLLQTAGYATALFSAGRVRRSEIWIDNQLEARLIRQERLADDTDPLTLHVVINEFALHRPVGGREVMAAQLRHLALSTELPTVTVQVLPVSVVSIEAMEGAFVVLDFPRSQSSMVHIEHVLGRERKDKADQVATTRLRFDYLRSLALDPERSVALIEQVADFVWSG